MPLRTEMRGEGLAGAKREVVTEKREAKEEAGAVLTKVVIAKPTQATRVMAD